jgi:predicted phosphodiesterase
MLAIISDVHANLEALQAVLADLDAQGATDVYCLGDVVGYGPDPLDCLDLVMRRCRVAVLGNHDRAALHLPGSWGFAPSARRAILWTRQELAAPVPDRETAGLRLRFLNELPQLHREGGLTLAHGSPCDDHVNEYVFPEDANDGWKMRRLFGEFEGCCFVGHTHMPGVFVEHGGGEAFEFVAPERYQFGGGKALVNVGSVGQPRDGDWRASYVLFDGEAVQFRRVEYDIDATVRKIGGAPELAGWFAERLRDGR